MEAGLLQDARLAEMAAERLVRLLMAGIAVQGMSVGRQGTFGLAMASQYGTHLVIKIGTARIFGDILAYDLLQAREVAFQGLPARLLLTGSLLVAEPLQTLKQEIMTGPIRRIGLERPAKSRLGVRQLAFVQIQPGTLDQGLSVCRLDRQDLFNKLAATVALAGMARDARQTQQGLGAGGLAQAKLLQVRPRFLESLKLNQEVGESQAIGIVAGPQLQCAPVEGHRVRCRAGHLANACPQEPAFGMLRALLQEQFQ